jgi:flagellar motor switch/type III secretory pathway protein FliN
VIAPQSPAEALSGLRSIDAAAASWISAASRLLAEHEVAVRSLYAAKSGMWFAAADSWFRLDVSDGDAIVLSPERIEAAIAALDRFDPALRAIEAALGLSLDANALGSLPEDDVIAFALTYEGLMLALAIRSDTDGHADWIERARALPIRADALPVPYVLTIAGPRLPMAEARTIEGGDLVLLSDHAEAWLSPVDGEVIVGRFAFTGRFTATTRGPAMPEVSSPADFAVPLQIRLPERMTSAATLAALVPGATLAVGLVTDGLPVELIVGGRRLACGELVRIGDGFAVLIEEQAPIADDVLAETMFEDAAT